MSDSSAFVRMIIVAAAAVGLILFVAFVVSRLLRTRTRGMSIRMQVFLALSVIVGAFAFGRSQRRRHHGGWQRPRYPTGRHCTWL